MTTIKDPPRLFESLDAPAELRSWLQNAHEDRLPDTTISSLLARLDASLVQPVPRHQPLRSLTKVRVTKKLASVLVVLGVGAVGTVAVIRHVGNHDAPMARSLSHWNTQLPSADVSSRLDWSESKPITEPLEPPKQENAEGSQDKSLRSRLRAQGRAAEVAPPKAAPNVTEASSDEYKLLRAARSALDREPARALALTGQHAREFPKGMLGQEREAIAINALIRLGRMGEARERGARFIRAYPGSPHSKRIEAAIQK